VGAPYRLGALSVVTLRDGRVQALDAFLDPEVHRRFGLPCELG
jgi:ketosteroid isomerase-like protein